MICRHNHGKHDCQIDTIGDCSGKADETIARLVDRAYDNVRTSKHSLDICQLALRGPPRR